ncbi:MAG: Redoxin domain protein [Alphaproteobacteria bacterium]|jgi:peroxiredoxin|nr:Redoxin domain protein [Alphaproteobacteria bacterium]
MSTIQIGDRLPSLTLKKVTASGAQDINTESLFKDKTVALFALPGAFTPVCTATHLPGFSAKMDQFKSKGIDVMCLSVNDPFVMEAWGKSTHTHPDMALLADWNAEFTKAVGLTLDGSGAGLGLRSLRYSMLVKDGVVTALNVEKSPGVCELSSADHLLETL